MELDRVVGRESLELEREVLDLQYDVDETPVLRRVVGMVRAHRAAPAPTLQQCFSVKQ